MAKGFIRGTLWGAGISLGTVTVLSLATGDLSQRDSPVAAALGEGAAVAPGGNRDKAGVGPTAVGLATQDVPAPEPDTLAALVADALVPAAVPQTGGATALPEGTPEPDPALSGIADAATEAPDVSYTIAQELTTPSNEPQLSISTDPAQPQAPEVVSQASAFAEATDQTAEEETPEEQAEQSLAPSDGVAASIEVVALDIDPEQPVLPLSGMPSLAFDADVELPASPMADVAVDLGAAAEVETKVTAALAPDKALVAPVGPGPSIAQEAEQPVPVSVPDVSSGIAGSVAAEAASPQIDTATELPAPAAVETLSAKEDSLNAQVNAGTDVAAPETLDAPDQSVAAPGSPAEDIDVAIAAAVLPDASGPERSVPFDVQQPATPTSDAPDEAAPADTAQAETPPAETPPAQTAAPVQQAEVRINRLPSLGGAQTNAVVAPAPRVPSAPRSVPAAARNAGASPLERFNADFAAPVGKPLMAVILMDEGRDLTDAITGIDAVKALPYPVSVAVDALLPDAPARMAAYRAAGFEVLASLDLPPGATASDAEVNVSVALEQLPEVIGVLEGTGSGVQTTPMAGRQVASILAQTGHGFVTQNRGLNTVQKLAVREGVPARTVFRDLDSQGQSEIVIRRFMDQAAFRAGQDDGVVMLGRFRQETLAALLSWTLQDRASSVAMAPVSAVLTQP